MTRAPDYRGLFLRGYGSQTHSQNNGNTIGVTATLHQSGALGVVQGDANRVLTGSLSTGASGVTGIPISGSGVFGRPYSRASVIATVYSTGGTYNRAIRLDTSLAVPTANENRPANMAVRYLIRAKS